MFTKEKNPSEKQTLTSATLISAGTQLNGDVNCENDLRIDGTIIGNVCSSSKIIIGPSGVVDGNIEGVQAEVVGTVQGNILVKELLQLKGKGTVSGNIVAAQLQIEPTATFNGQCQMGAIANIVQMSTANEQTAEAK